MEDSKMIKVSNRTNNNLGYRIPDMGNLFRSYMPKEEKTITFEELRKLRNIRGGKEMIEGYLMIKDRDAIDALDIHIEPEYFYTEQEVINLMQNGSLDEFLDCLDFAPDGVLELIKEHSVKLPLNDVRKRNAIREKLDFDVDTAISIKDDMDKAEKESGVEETVKVRRVAKEENTGNGTKARRVVVKES